MAEPLGYGTRNGIVGHTHTNRAPSLEHLGKSGGCRKYKRKRTGQIGAEYTESLIVDACILTRHRQSVTYYGKRLLLRIHPLDLTQPLDSSVVERVTAERVERIGGINDYTPLQESVGRLVEIAVIETGGIHAESLHGR